MIGLTTAMLAHLGGNVHTISYFWEIRRSDNVDYYFTDHDEPLVFNGHTWIPNESALITSLTLTRGLNVDSMQGQILLDDDESTGFITPGDIIAKRFKGARVDVFLANREDFSMGVRYLCVDWTMGNIRLLDDVAVFELRSFTQKLSAGFVDLCSPDCRNTLGDEHCTVDIGSSPYNDEGTVGSLIFGRNRFSFSGIPVPDPDTAPTYKYGNLTWLTGANAGLVEKIKSLVPGNIAELFQAMPYEIQTGDTFSAQWGCDKQFSTCNRKFDNVINFDGELFVPASGQIEIKSGRTNPERHGWTHPS